MSSPSSGLRVSLLRAEINLPARADAFKNLFGVAKPGKDWQEFEAETELYDFVRQDAAKMDSRLTGTEREKFHPYLEGHEEAGVRRRKLLAMAQVLEKHAPLITEKFSAPKFETDWWDAGLSVGIGALTSGVTNVLTISSGLCTPGGSWSGIGATTVGHTLGHTSQTRAGQAAQNQQKKSGAD